MARVSPIQESFAAGELGQRVRGRVSTDVYKRGLAAALNWRPLVQGPIRLRSGSFYVTPVDSDNWVSGAVGATGLRVFTFPIGLDLDAIVEVGNGQVIVRNSIDGGPISGGNTGNLITDPNFEEVVIPDTPPVDTASWQNTDNVYTFNTDPGFPQDAFCSYSISTVFINNQFPGGMGPFNAIIFHGHTKSAAPDGFNAASFGNTLAAPVILPAGSELELNEFSFWFLQAAIGGIPTYANLGPLPWADPKIRITIGTAPGLSDVHTEDVPIPSLGIWQKFTTTFIPGAGNNTLYFTYGYVWTGATNPVPSVPTNAGCAGEDNIAWRVSLPSWVAPLAGGSGTPVEFTSPWTTAQLECLQYVADPGEQVAYFMHPEVETHRLRLDVGEWTFEPISSILLPTAYQAPSPNTWGPGNFPSAGTIHEGRLWLAGTPNEPATIWASASGDYQNFNGAAPADKADPLLFPLSSAGNIQTLTSRKELVINTDISEVVGTSQQGVIAFDDFSFPKQTDWGSNCVQPIVVGREMVFTSNSRTRLRTFSDEGGTNFGWDGQELSLLAQEIFSTPVRRMVYLDEPAYQACFLLADGTMGMATYFYPEEVIGWWRFSTAYNGDREFGDTTQPGLGNQAANASQPTNQIMDITKINTSDGAKLWMVINRVGYPGTQLPAHEVLSLDNPNLPPIAMDTWATRPIDSVTGELTDLDFLTDQSVNCVVQHDIVGAGSVATPTYTVHPNITVIAGVSSPLEDWAREPGNVAHVGLFYSNNFKLLPVEGVSNLGTAQVAKRRWNKIHARLNNSIAPLINGEPPKDRTPVTPMGTGEDFVTEDKEYSELGTDQGELEITQDRPLVTEVLALFGKIISKEV